MTTNRIILGSYKIIKKIFEGKGLTKFSIIRKMKNYALINFKTEFVYVQGNKIFLDEKDCLQLSVNEIIEPVETKLFNDIIKNGEVLVDVGANIGYFTLLMAKLTGPKGKIFSFEPEYSNLDQLKKNIILNKAENVIIPYSIAFSESTNLSFLNLQDLTPGSALHTESNNFINQTKNLVGTITPHHMLLTNRT